MALIAEAQTQLEALKRNHHKEVIAQIKELAASIGVTVDIREPFNIPCPKDMELHSSPLKGVKLTNQSQYSVPVF